MGVYITRTCFPDGTVTDPFNLTRKEPAQVRASAEDVFVDVTWPVCISIKQFNIEFKVRSHLGNTNFYHIHLYNLTHFGHFYFLYVYCITSLITFACLTKIVHI